MSKLESALLVALADDADEIASTPAADRPWCSVDAKGLTYEDFAELHCILDGVDPHAALSPPESWRHPFTFETLPVTWRMKYSGKGEIHCSSPDEYTVFELSPELTRALANLAPDRVQTLAGWIRRRTSSDEGPGLDEASATEWALAVKELAALTDGQPEVLMLWMSDGSD